MWCPVTFLHNAFSIAKSNTDQAIRPVSMNIERSEGNELFSRKVQNLVTRPSGYRILCAFPPEQPIILWLCYVIAELQRPEGTPSGASYSYRKEKETHELIFSWLSWPVALLVDAYAQRRRRRRRRRSRAR